MTESLKVKASNAVDDVRVAAHAAYDDASVAAHNTLKDAGVKAQKVSDDVQIGVNKAVAGADHLKIQTAEALEDAARKLRATDVASRGKDVKDILHDVEYRVNKFKTECGVEYDRIEEGYHQSVEPVENIIIDHPLPAVLVATGIGVLIGMLLFKVRD